MNFVFRHLISSVQQKMSSSPISWGQYALADQGDNPGNQSFHGIFRKSWQRWKSWIRHLIPYFVLSIHLIPYFVLIYSFKLDNATCLNKLKQQFSSIFPYLCILCQNKDVNVQKYRERILAFQTDVLNMHVIYHDSGNENIFTIL